MVVEIKSVTKDVPDRIVLYPWRDIKQENWEQYIGKGDKWYEYDQGWRQIGVEIVYPSPSQIRLLGDASTDNVFRDSTQHIVLKDPKKAANVIAYQMVTDLKGFVEDGKPINYAEKSQKDWFYVQLCQSSFILNTLRNEIIRAGGGLRDEESEQDENFTNSLETSSGLSTVESPSSSEDKKEIIA